MAVNIDKELIDRCIKGDQAAWKELIIRYERLVYSVALTLCSETDDASDIFQQVWLELHKQLASLQHVEALPAWLITVTRRTTYKLIASRHGSEPLDEELPDVKQQLGAIEREHALERALAQLGDKCRQLIDLLYFTPDEPSYLQISERLGIPVASIGPTRARCLEKLKKLLG